MPILIIAVLAVVQGITEFLPISSSGHLILTWRALEAAGYDAGFTGGQELALDVAVHLGALAAVMVYLRKDIAQMLRGGLAMAGGRMTGGGKLALQVVIATLPVIVAGVLMKDWVETLRDGKVIAWTTIIFGVLLYLCDRWGGLTRRLDSLTMPQALLIGASQVLALIPGTSRSGITMTAARALGFERTEAARFSLLLSIPAILGAGALLAVDVYRAGNLALGVDALIAILLSFVTALITIVIMMRWLQHFSFTPFVIYRLILGVGLLFIL